MANGQTQDPLQGFIEQFMTMRQFAEQQRQFGMQQALQQRQVENAEIQQFAALAPFVQEPEEREALAQQFAMRMPHMAQTFASLARTIPISEQVYKANLLREGVGSVSADQVASVALTGMDQGRAATSSVQAGREPEDILLGIRTGEGQELTAGQEQQGGQFQQNLTETIRQFGITASQRDRGLGIQEFGVAQQGEIARRASLFGAGFGGHVLRAERSDRLREIQESLRNPALTPEARRALQQEEADVEGAIVDMEEWIAAQMGPAGGAGGPTGGMGLNQLLQAEGAAFDDINEATDRGQEITAIQRFNFVRSLLGGGSMLQPEPRSGLNPADWWGMVMGNAGGSEAIPFQPQSAPNILPFIAQPGGGAR